VVDTGNPNLNPQKGEIWSVGLDVSPHLLEGFTASITLFNNLLRGGITSPCAPGCILNNGALNNQFTICPNGATAAEIAAKVNDVPIVTVLPQTTYYIFRRAQTNALDIDVTAWTFRRTTSSRRTSDIPISAVRSRSSCASCRLMAAAQSTASSTRWA
jgi:hypothetical protein